jgi:hypothetical protein
MPNDTGNGGIKLRFAITNMMPAAAIITYHRWDIMGDYGGLVFCR